MKTTEEKKKKVNIRMAQAKFSRLIRIVICCGDLSILLKFPYFIFCVKLFNFNFQYSANKIPWKNARG